MFEFLGLLNGFFFHFCFVRLFLKSFEYVKTSSENLILILAGRTEEPLEDSLLLRRQGNQVRKAGEDVSGVRFNGGVVLVKQFERALKRE